MKAIADFSEAIRLDPKDADSYFNRGGPWIRLKNNEKAIADFNEAVRLDPTDALAYANRGWAWSDKKDYDKAIADFTEVIRLEPKNAAAHGYRGSAWSKKEEHDKAITDFSEAIRLEPRNANRYHARGSALVLKNEFEKAISDFNETIRLDPLHAQAYASRAWLWATFPENKCRDGKSRHRIGFRKPPAGELSEYTDAFHVGTLAAAHAEAGEFEAAVKWQLKANALYPDAKDRKVGEARLKLYQDKKPYREIVP